MSEQHPVLVVELLLVWEFVIVNACRAHTQVRSYSCPEELLLSRSWIQTGLATLSSADSCRSWWPARTCPSASVRGTLPRASFLQRPSCTFPEKPDGFSWSA